jgi:hypothetical protein
MGSVATALCARNEAEVVENGIVYSVGAFGTRPCVVIGKRRAPRPGETLPYGVLPTDSPQAAVERIKARHGEPAFAVSGSDPTPTSVHPACGRSRAGDYRFMFLFDHDGRMTDIYEGTLFPYFEG